GALCFLNIGAEYPYRNLTSGGPKSGPLGSLMNSVALLVHEGDGSPSGSQPLSFSCSFSSSRRTPTIRISFERWRWHGQFSWHLSAHGGSGGDERSRTRRVPGLRQR